MKRWRRALWLAPVALFVFLWWHAGWDIRYLARVLWHRDSSTHDLEWKAQRGIAAHRPRPWQTGGACPADLATTGALAYVIVRHGVLTCEWYGNDGVRGRPAMAFSVSKIVTSLLVSRSGLPLDTPITQYIPELAERDARFGKITLANLLDMRSGIEFNEDTHFPWVDQDAPAVYYASDLARTIVARPVIEAMPGEKFVYNDYAPNLNGLAIQRATGQDVIAATQRLWDELGAEDPAAWLVDGKGFAWHESGFVVTARDLARIGQFVLDRPDDPWTMRSWIASPTVETFAGTAVGYRNAWWTLDGTLVAMGRWGQVMVVDPKTDTVIVRMGWDGGGETNIAIARRLVRLARGSQ